MAIAFVIGNGISRQHVNLDNLKKHGKIYGCNALYRDFTPDCLVATDRPIAAEIQNSGYSLKNRFHTRRPFPSLGGKGVPKEYFGYSSGPIAVSLAAIDGCGKIYLIGFDMGATETNAFNNIYAGTQFYKNHGSLPTFTGNWIKQIDKIMNDFSHIEFIRVCGPTTARIDGLETIKNLSHMAMATFVDRINK